MEGSISFLVLIINADTSIKKKFTILVFTTLNSNVKGGHFKISQCIYVYLRMIYQSRKYSWRTMHCSVMNRTPIWLGLIVDLNRDNIMPFVHETVKLGNFIFYYGIQKLLMYFCELLPMIIPNCIRYFFLLAFPFLF
jgi:hypothetical protein